MPRARRDSWIALGMESRWAIDVKQKIPPVVSAAACVFLWVLFAVYLTCVIFRVLIYSYEIASTSPWKTNLAPPSLCVKNKAPLDMRGSPVHRLTQVLVVRKRTKRHLGVVDTLQKRFLIKANRKSRNFRSYWVAKKTSLWNVSRETPVISAALRQEVITLRRLIKREFFGLAFDNGILPPKYRAILQPSYNPSISRSTSDWIVAADYEETGKETAHHESHEANACTVSEVRQDPTATCVADPSALPCSSNLGDTSPSTNEVGHPLDESKYALSDAGLQLTEDCKKTLIRPDADTGAGLADYTHFVSGLENSGYPIISTRSSVTIAAPENPDLIFISPPEGETLPLRWNSPLVSRSHCSFTICADDDVPSGHRLASVIYSPTRSPTALQEVHEDYASAACDLAHLSSSSVPSNESESYSDHSLVILSGTFDISWEKYQHPIDIEWDLFSTTMRAGVRPHETSVRPRLSDIGIFNHRYSSSIATSFKVSSGVQAIRRPEIIYAGPKAAFHRPNFRRASSNPLPANSRNIDGVIAAYRMLDESRNRVLRESLKIQHNAMPCIPRPTSRSAVYPRANYQSSRVQAPRFSMTPSTYGQQCPGKSAGQMNLKRNLDFRQADEYTLASNCAVPTFVNAVYPYSPFKRQKL